MKLELYVEVENKEDINKKKEKLLISFSGNKSFSELLLYKESYEKVNNKKTIIKMAIEEKDLEFFITLNKILEKTIEN